MSVDEIHHGEYDVLLVKMNENYEAVGVSLMKQYNIVKIRAGLLKYVAFLLILLYFYYVKLSQSRSRGSRTARRCRR